MARLRLVVLVSGRGSNLENLLRASKDGRMDADIVLVASNKPDAPALDVARKAGVATFASASKGRAQAEHEDELRPAIEEARPDLVLLAGYMRILTPAFIRAYEGRLINIHPSLLPAFPGIDAQAQAHAANVRIAGCTTHFVTEAVDAGPIMMQAAVAIPPGASVDDVRARILEAEHELYPRTVQLLATKQVRYQAGRVVFERGASSFRAPMISPEARP